MRPGDHICVDRGSFWDHGIYLGQEQVVHFSDRPVQGSEASVVCTALGEFAPGGWNSWVGVVDYQGQPHFGYPEIIERARSQLGKHGCELDGESRAHFAKWCATGEPLAS